MPKGQLFINGKDAYTTWGISLDNSSLSALMTPSPNKEYIENSSRLEHGKRVILNNPKMDERQLNLTINLVASNENEFFERYLSFCEELKNAQMDIRTSFQPNIVYKTYYQSCSQFTQFMRGIAKFSLKLVEYNPNDRSLT